LFQSLTPFLFPQRLRTDHLIFLPILTSYYPSCLCSYAENKDVSGMETILFSIPSSFHFSLDSSQNFCEILEKYHYNIGYQSSALSGIHRLVGIWFAINGRIIMFHKIRKNLFRIHGSQFGKFRYEICKLRFKIIRVYKVLYGIHSVFVTKI